MNPNPRNVMITGAGSGLGRAMAVRFAAAGDRVAVTDVNGERAENVMQEIQAAGGVGFSQTLDVTSELDWKDLHDRVLLEWRSADILVNNAGVAAAGNLEDTPMSDWEWVIDIDLMGVVRGCRRFLPMFRAQGSGHIVNVASFAGLASAPGISAYGVAKAGVVALSEQLRAELMGSGVGVSVVCPAFVDTNLLQTFRAPDDAYADKVRRWMNQSEVTPEHVAELVYEAVKNTEFMVLTHSQTRWAWRLKRWMPERYFREIARRASTNRKEAA